MMCKTIQFTFLLLSALIVYLSIGIVTTILHKELIMQSSDYKFEFHSETDDFFIVLPSNTESSNGFDENKICSYTVNLPKNLSFHGDCYVGLTEISYTKSWMNHKKQFPLGLYKRGKYIDTGRMIPQEHMSIPGLVG